MKIVKLQAENFKRLKAVEIVPSKRIVEITGKCEQGKTTILDAIQAALCGVKPEEPIRAGKDKAKIVVDLDDKIVTRTFTASGGALKVESKDGAKYPSPQALLDKLVGKIAFNPLEFAKADSKKQVDMLLHVVDIKVDQNKLKDISGVVVTPMPNPLDMLNAAFKTVYENRTAVNRQLDAAQKVLDSMPEVEKVDPVLLTELVAEKERLETINRDNQSQIDAASQQNKKVHSIALERDAIALEIESIESNLAEAKKRLAVKTKEHDSAEKERVQMQVIVNGIKFEDLTDINTRISKADETNHKAQQYQQRTLKQSEVNSVKADADALTAKLQKIKDYKSEIIKNTKFPVQGLDFANGGVIYNGHPFSQASGAQKMRVGLGIGMAANPELRVVMIDGYESLDSDQRRIVEEMAAEHDFQVWTTSVDSSGKVGIYIEDGEIKHG
ncbi:MAG: family ATPase [Firmicutes bacterium]|nr:family ATPase [Bacillota bacterium]